MMSYYPGELIVAFSTWLPVGFILFILAYHRANIKPLYASLCLYVVLNINMFVLELPKIAIFSTFAWNWQGKILEFIWPLFLVYSFKCLTPHEVGLHLPQSNKSFLFAFIAGVIVAVMLIAISLGFGFFPKNQLNMETMLYQLTMPGLAEEMIYRGILLAILNKYLGKNWQIGSLTFGWGVLLVSLIFVMAHLFQFDRGSQHLIFVYDGMISTLILIVMSLTLGFIREKTNSIWPAVIFHNISNGVFYIGAFILV